MSTTETSSPASATPSSTAASAPGPFAPDMSAPDGRNVELDRLKALLGGETPAAPQEAAVPAEEPDESASENEHDGCLGFNWDGRKWKVSMYRVPGKPAIDFSELPFALGASAE